MRVAFSLAFLMALLVTSFTAVAQRVEGDRARGQGVYSAEVPVNGQGETERGNAFARGLAEVLGKMSGDRGAASRPGIGPELRRAKEYVSSYDYRQDEGIGPSGAPSYRTTLVVRYDEGRVNELAATYGLAVWPQPRPKPVLWLAIDDGSGPRLVGLPQSNAARAVLDRAVARGYRLGLPGGTAAEQAVVGSIWRGDTAAVARASQRYSPPMQLVGKLYRNRGGWTADWIFVDGGRVLSRWSHSGADARQVMVTGADGAADALMRRYARPGRATSPAGTYRVRFIGIDSSGDYLRLSGYLQQLSVVGKITPLRATAEAVEFNVEMRAGPTGFRRAVAAGSVLEAVGGETGVAPPDDGDPTTPPLPAPTPSVQTYRLR